MNPDLPGLKTMDVGGCLVTKCKSGIQRETGSNVVSNEILYFRSRRYVLWRKTTLLLHLLHCPARAHEP